MTIRHMPALDGLRGVAVLLVLAYHAQSFINIPGQYGVTLFFFISGFIITRILIAQNLSTSDLKAFYLRRFFRLAPALFVFMLAAGLIYGGLDHAVPMEDFKATLLYYASYHAFNQIGGQPSPFELTWSLAVEEHFYIVFPLLFVFVPKNRFTSVLGILAVVILAWRTFAAIHLGISAEHIARHTDTRIDSIVWGCLLSTLISTESPLLRYIGDLRALYCAVLLTAADFAIHSAVYRNTVHYTVQGLCLMVIFCCLFWSRTAPKWAEKMLRSDFLVFFGRISYSLYLYNVLMLVCGRLLIEDARIAMVFGVAGSIGAAYLSYRYVETPARRLGARLTSHASARSVAPV